MAAPITTGPDAYEKPYQLQRSVSAPLATAPANFPLRKVIEQHADVIAPLCPPGTSPETVIAQLYAACLRTPQIAQATPQSLIVALSVAIPTGGVIGHDVYLLPFRNKGVWEVAYAPDYKFLSACIVQAGGARSIMAETVYANDVFRVVKGTTPHLVHEPAWNKPRGAPIAYYATAFHGANVPPTFVVMTLAEVETIRAKSKQWNKEKVGECPDWYGMARAVHRLGKLLPKKANPRLQQLAAIMDADERVDAAESGEIVGEITPMPAEAPVTVEDVQEAFDAETIDDERDPALVAALDRVVNGKRLGDLRNSGLTAIRKWASGKLAKDGDPQGRLDSIIAACDLIVEAREAGEIEEPAKEVDHA